MWKKTWKHCSGFLESEQTVILRVPGTCSSLGLYLSKQTNISRIFKAFLAMEKLGEKLGEKFIFLPNPNSKQFDRKKKIDKIFRCVNLWNDKQNGKF